MTAEYTVARDPLFLAAVGVFSILTTALPAILGQALFMTVLQSATLTILLGVVFRTGSRDGADPIGPALRTLIVWTLAQALVISLLSLVAGERVDSAIRDGFRLSTATVEWLYTDSQLPDTIRTAPGQRVLEYVATTVGSYLTGGLVGVWALVEAVNRGAFLTGSLLPNLDSGIPFPAAFFPWSILRVASYIGFVAALAEPLWTGRWSPIRIWSRRRTLLLTSLALLAIALILESFLPDVWRSLFT